MGEAVGPMYFFKLTREKIILPDGTQVDPDGTLHFTNGIVARLTGDKNNPYEFYKSDETKIG
jgi:hypothetical protein